MGYIMSRLDDTRLDTAPFSIEVRSESFSLFPEFDIWGTVSGLIRGTLSGSDTRRVREELHGELRCIEIPYDAIPHFQLAFNIALDKHNGITDHRPSGEVHDKWVRENEDKRLLERVDEFTRDELVRAIELLDKADTQ